MYKIYFFDEYVFKKVMVCMSIDDYSVLLTFISATSHYCWFAICPFCTWRHFCRLTKVSFRSENNNCRLSIWLYRLENYYCLCSIHFFSFSSAYCDHTIQSVILSKSLCNLFSKLMHFRLYKSRLIY
jgi:hypothetical protein